jgi:hypothetical protein
MSFVPDEVGDVPAITAALARLDADRELLLGESGLVP